MRVERHQKRLLAAAAAMLVLFAAVGWWPAHHRRSVLSRRLAAAQQVLVNDRIATDQLVRLRGQVERLQATLAQGHRVVPRQDQLDDVLRSLTEAMNRFEVSDRDVLAGRGRSHSDYTVLPVKVRFKGTFPATFGILEHIETLPRLIRVDRLELDQRSDKLGAPLQVWLDLSTFMAGGG